MSNGSSIPAVKLSGDGTYEIYALRYGSMPQRRVHENFVRRDMHDGPMAMDFYVWIVRNAKRTVLVDTGFSPQSVAERPFTLLIDPVEALRRMGIDPDEIEHVVITHLHCDHAGNIDRFAKARFHVQDAEVGFATGRCMCEPNQRFPFDLEPVVTLVRRIYADRVCFHDGDADLFPGISLHLVPGHTPGMQAVRVMTPRGPVLLASDSSHYYANYLRRAPFALTVDAIATLSSYSKLVKIGGAVDHIIPGHDPKVGVLYPKYEFGGVEVIALHEEPKHHDVSALSRVDN